MTKSNTSTLDCKNHYVDCDIGASGEQKLQASPECPKKEPHAQNWGVSILTCKKLEDVNEESQIIPSESSHQRPRHGSSETLTQYIW